MSKIIIFIDGPFPSEADLKLGVKLGTKCFRNVREASGIPELCHYATAVDPKIIPEGYPTGEAPEGDPEAPKVNPTSPKAKVTSPGFLVPEDK